MEKENVLLLILIILLFVLYYFSGCKSENFADLKAEKDNCVLMVFLTKQCPHCVNYDKNQHAALENNLAQYNIKIKKVYADEDDDDLFTKNDVKFVPAYMVMKGDAAAKIGGPITPENVLKKAQSI
jgi:thioredoxin-related protein